MPRKRKRYRPATIRLRTDQFFGFPEAEQDDDFPQERSFNQMAGIIYIPGVAGTSGSSRQQYADYGQKYTGEMLRTRGPIESGGVAQSGTQKQDGFVLAVFALESSVGFTPRALTAFTTGWGTAVQNGMKRSTATMGGSIYGSKTNMDGVIVDRGPHSVDSTQFIASADCRTLLVGFPLDHESERAGTGYFTAIFKLDETDSGLTQADLESNVEMSLDIGLATTTGSVGDPIVSGNLFRITQRFWDNFGNSIADDTPQSVSGAAPNGWFTELINAAIGTRANDVWRSVESSVSFKGDNLS